MTIEPLSPRSLDFSHCWVLGLEANQCFCSFTSEAFFSSIGPTSIQIALNRCLGLVFVLGIPTCPNPPKYLQPPPIGGQLIRARKRQLASQPAALGPGLFPRQPPPVSKQPALPEAPSPKASPDSSPRAAQAKRAEGGSTCFRGWICSLFKRGLQKPIKPLQKGMGMKK